MCSSTPHPDPLHQYSEGPSPPLGLSSSIFRRCNFPTVGRRPTRTLFINIQKAQAPHSDPSHQYSESPCPPPLERRLTAPRRLDHLRGRRRPPTSRDPLPARMLNDHHTAPRRRHRRSCEQLRAPNPERQTQNPPPPKPSRQHTDLRQSHRVGISIQSHHPAIQTRHHTSPTRTATSPRPPGRTPKRHMARLDQTVDQPRRQRHRVTGSKRHRPSAAQAH